jgi:hypothetical protein
VLRGKAFSMIIETQEYRDVLKGELTLFDLADSLAAHNKRYSIKSGVLVVLTSPKLQVVCGNFASFRTTTYSSESGFHPEMVALDSFNADLDGLHFYVSKLNIKGEPLPSRPCKHCMLALHEEPQITHVVYRDDKLRIVKEELR